MKRILIQNGHLWSAHDDFKADILIVDGKIIAIGADLGKQYKADETIDAGGLYVLPGGIDVHTHMELPFMGSCSADDFETGTLAGLFGGTTTIVDFAIQSKGAPIMDCINQWHEKARNKAVGDYGFHCAVTEFNEKIQKEIPEVVSQGITSFKAFMAYKGSLMMDDRQLMGLLAAAKEHGALVSVHAENGDMLDFMMSKCKGEGKTDLKYHPVVHMPEAEVEAAGRAMALAEYLETDLYIVHTTCAGVLQRLQQNKPRQHRVLIETCPQYLLLDDSCYAEPNFAGAKYVMSPPIRKKENQEALWNGIQCGSVQVVGTDHCPFNLKGQKEMGKDDFLKIPNGAPGVENRLEICFSEGVVKGRISMNRFVEVMCTNPARIFGMPDKGSLAVGKDADIVIFDPEEKHTLSAKTHHQNVDYNLYEGWNITGKVKTVLLNGNVVIRNGKADQIRKGQGRFIKRRPYGGK